LGGKLLDDLESSLSTLTSACLQPSHSKVAHAASRVQGEARNANFAISTALAMGGSAESTGVEEQLQMQLEKAKGELATVRKEEEATKTKTAVEVETLNRRLSEKEGEVKALQGQLRSASRSSAQQKEEEEAVAKDLLSAAKTTALEAANSDLSNEVKQLKAQLAHAKAVSIAGASQHDCADSTAAVASRPNTSTVMGRPGTAAALSTDQLRQEWLTLRGELGVARSQLASTRQDKVQLETRLRSEKEKMDDVSKVCDGKDEQIAHLRSELRSLERLSNASGNADTFEAVLAEEMHTMRESFEQKIASIKAQMERENTAFSRERKEMRENFDKEAKAMKRQIEILQVKVGDYSQTDTSSQPGTQTLTLDE